MQNLNEFSAHTILPSTRAIDRLMLEVSSDHSPGRPLGIPVATTGAIPAGVGFDLRQLALAGFDASTGSTLVLPQADGSLTVVYGIGDPGAATADSLRNAGAAFARAVAFAPAIDIMCPQSVSVSSAHVARALVEGIVLARYNFDPLPTVGTHAPLSALTLLASAERKELQLGAAQGLHFAEATAIARDLANTQYSRLSVVMFVELAQAFMPGRGVEVEVFDKDQLSGLGCGGLLGVGAGSAEPPSMIVLRYGPKAQPTAYRSKPMATLGLVGNSIIGKGCSLSSASGAKVHAQMKHDMAGAAAIFGAMAQLQAFECPVAVTAWLMCAGSVSARAPIARGDVITTRRGKTVEVINTHAEGCLVMADALVLAVERGVNAIVDCATLTNGTLAATMGNNPNLRNQVSESSARTSESVREVSLEPRYRERLDSKVADLRDPGGVLSDPSTVGLFLQEFVGSTPWIHIDIAGATQPLGDPLGRGARCIGFGARLLLDFTVSFTNPQPKPAESFLARGRSGRTPKPIEPT